VALLFYLSPGGGGFGLGFGFGLGWFGWFGFWFGIAFLLPAGLRALCQLAVEATVPMTDDQWDMLGVAALLLVSLIVLVALFALVRF
jgi:hypothetical protein